MYDLVKDTFASVSLGEQLIKGKGMMQTYFLFNAPAADWSRMKNLILADKTERKRELRDPTSAATKDPPPSNRGVSVSPVGRKSWRGGNLSILEA